MEGMRCKDFLSGHLTSITLPFEWNQDQSFAQALLTYDQYGLSNAGKIALTGINFIFVYVTFT